MASPSTVITMGFGSFGSVNLLPTLGYGIGATVTPVISAVIPFSVQFPYVMDVSIQFPSVVSHSPQYGSIQQTDVGFSRR